MFLMDEIILEIWRCIYNHQTYLDLVLRVFLVLRAALRVVFIQNIHCLSEHC